MKRLRPLSVSLVLILLTACAAQAQSSPLWGGIHPTPTDTALPTATASPTSTPTLTPSPTPTATATPEPSPVSIMAVGDIMLARTVGERILAEGPQIVFAEVQSLFAEADILAGNLECAITDRGRPQPKSYTFAAPPLSAQALGLAGFDIAVLGNNHALDYGQEGIAQTLHLLAEQGIATLGFGPLGQAAGPLFLEKNGVRIAFLSYVDVPREYRGFDTRTWIATAELPGIAWAEPQAIQAGVSAARQQADVVIVFMHFGYEGNELPVRYQRELSVAAAEAGAAAVIGSHPHLLQHIEKYHGALFAYSLGNFVFDDFDMPENRSVILNLRVDRNGLLDYAWLPVVIVDGLPRPATAEQSAQILKMLEPNP